MQTQITTQEIRDGFDQMIAKARELGNPDAVAAFELAREYHTNPDFKKALKDDCFRRTYKVEQ